jgi:hypothetical protein
MVKKINSITPEFFFCFFWLNYIEKLLLYHLSDALIIIESIFFLFKKKNVLCTNYLNLQCNEKYAF